MKHLKKVLLTAFVAFLAVIATACSSNKQTDNTSNSNNAKSVKLTYVEWDSEVASTNVVGQVLKDMGYNVELTPLDMSFMWQSIANKQADGMVAAWLPVTHEAQYNKYKDQLELLGSNFEGAKLGLVVPKYMNVNSIADLSNEAKKTVTGIDAGSGTMSLAEKTLKEYDNLKSWQLVPSSSGAMTAALDKAYKNKEEIVVTGWQPHWMFSKYDLKFLEDPKGTMGATETINSVARLGLKEDKPEVYNLLKNFKWSSEDINGVMLAISNGEKPEKAAQDWIANHQEEVNKWKESK
ncbi:glycine betaine ABC transporter substrate-binding protein [Holzapfeliella sp. JNUCC 72]